MYNVEIKDLAQEDINEISEYIYRFSLSKAIAKKIYNEIMGKILSLKIFPYLYPAYNSEYRVMTVRKRYRIFYKVIQDKKLVEIHYVFWAEEDYDSIIH